MNKMNFVARIFFWILILVSGALNAQVVDSVAIDTAEVEPPPYYLGIYLEGGGSFEPAASSHNMYSLMGFGVQYNRLAIGFTRYDFRGTVRALIIFPNAFTLKQRYGGVNLAYHLLDNDLFDFFIGGGYYKGDVTWQNEEDGQDFLRDEFDMIKLGLKGELALFRYFKPYASIGYQNMRDLNLSQVGKNDFSGLFFAMGIRIGYFNQ